MVDLSSSQTVHFQRYTTNQLPIKLLNIPIMLVLFVHPLRCHISGQETPGLRRSPAGPISQLQRWAVAAPKARAWANGSSGTFFCRKCHGKGHGQWMKSDEKWWKVMKSDDKWQKVMKSDEICGADFMGKWKIRRWERVKMLWQWVEDKHG